MHNKLSPIPAAAFRFVRVSSNKKTGPIPVSSTAAQSCPIACPMRTDNAGGCYASRGNSAIHWRALSEGKASTAVDAAGLFHAIKGLPRGQLWRMNEAGDLLHENENISAEYIRGLIDANKGKAGFTYTHHALNAHNAALISEANAEGFTVNVSTNNPQHADTVRAQYPGLPVVTLMSPDAWQGKHTVKTPAGNTIVQCPAEYQENITCSNCGLCAVSSRKGIVGFTAHGTGKKRVINIVKTGG